MLLALALALILDRVDRRVREPDELEDIFDLPIVGYVPQSGSLRKEDAGPQLRGPIAEAFRMLRTTLLYFNVDKNIRSLLVTSAAPKEGKTTVSLNLACTTAAGGAKVLLLEADLRHPALRKHIGDVPDGIPGLGEIIARDLDLHSGVTRVPLESSKEGRPLASLDVILAGPVPPNPADLLESQRMRTLIQEAERDYDLVVIDTPPTFVVPDAVPLVNQVSGVIVVARLGVTDAGHRTQAPGAARQPQRSDARPGRQFGRPLADPLWVHLRVGRVSQWRRRIRRCKASSEVAAPDRWRCRCSLRRR